MYKIILIISVSALLSLQVNRASVVRSDVRGDAKRSFDELWQVANEGLNGAITEFNIFFDQIYTASLATEDGLSKIRKKSEEYVSELDSLKDLANREGADIRACLGAESQINELEEINSKDLIACVNSQADVGINYLNGQINSLVTATWKLVNREESPLASCAATNENCINLITEIETNIPIVARKIKSVVDNERQTVELHIASVEGCVDQSMFKLEANGSSIIIYVNTCVHDIIG